MTDFAKLMEGPEHAPHTRMLRQVGWLGHSNDTFYPWGTSLEVIHQRERGGYTPAYDPATPVVYVGLDMATLDANDQIHKRSIIFLPEAIPQLIKWLVEEMNGCKGHE